MKKRVLILFILMNFFLYCDSKDVKGDKAAKSEPKENSVKNELVSINQTLERLYYPLKGGFSYKSTILEEDKIEIWFKQVQPILNDAFEKLPDEYILVIKGHTDPTGPEFVTEDKKGNMYYSTIRAENVKNFLIQQKFPQQRIKSFGVGSAEAVDMNNRKNPMNRRVTFSFIDENTSSIF